ncbi:MAG: aldehyde dehydrogenase [Actinomycetota bacterium]|nr:aldehyde dehydrogenase [Actinomycetota bacterium]
MWTRDRLFIGGQWLQPEGTEWLDVVSPTTEASFGRVPSATAPDVEWAVNAARRAFDGGPWPRMSLDERAEGLTRFVAAFERRTAEAVDLQIDEMGGVRKFLGPATHGVGPFLRRMIADGRAIPLRDVRDGVTGKVVVLREPLGVVAGIVPWNAPVMAAMTKVLPSLLMGCPILLKPAPESPLSAYLLAEAFDEAGLPPGLLSVLPGGVAVGQSLVSHPGVDMVTFTGSTGAGRQIAATCGQQMKPAALELGGKSAAVILDDADLDRYLAVIVDNALRNTGQVCVATTRILVARSQHDDVVDRLVDAVAAMKVGDPHDPQTDFGPLASARQRERVEGYIATGRDEGAKVVLGGGRPPGFDRGWFVEPTIFVGVDPSMTIAQEEIFGPVLAVLPYGSDDEAVAIANDSPYGLGGAVYTSDPERALAVASRIRTGTCSVNDGLPAGGGGPFGGYKQSGLGRERGPEGLESFLELKSVAFGTDPPPRAQAIVQPPSMTSVEPVM